jgi:hypothetical protein
MRTNVPVKIPTKVVTSNATITASTMLEGGKKRYLSVNSCLTNLNLVLDGKYSDTEYLFAKYQTSTLEEIVNSVIFQFEVAGTIRLGYKNMTEYVNFIFLGAKYPRYEIIRDASFVIVLFDERFIPLFTKYFPVPKGGLL